MRSDGQVFATKIIIIVIILYLIYWTLQSEKTPTLRLGKKTQNHIKNPKHHLYQVRECVLEKMKWLRGFKPVFGNIPDVINGCNERFGFDMSFIQAMFERFIFLQLKRAPQENECSFVSLGIEPPHYHHYETEMKALYPACQFYGADPDLKKGEVYKSIGSFFPLTIDRISETRSLDSTNESESTKEPIETTGVLSFLTRNVKNTFIYFVSMDVNGAEYRILKKPSPLAEKDIDICQMTVKFNLDVPDVPNTDEKLVEVFSEFIESTMFVPIRATKMVRLRLNYIGFVNIGSSKCVSLLF